FSVIALPPPESTLFPYTTLFRSGLGVYMYQDTQFNVVMKFITSVSFQKDWTLRTLTKANGFKWATRPVLDYGKVKIPIASMIEEDRKSTRLNSSHVKISYAVFCL